MYGKAKVLELAIISGHATVCGHAIVYGHATVCGHANVYGYATVCGHANIYDSANVYGYANVFESANVFENHHVQYSSVTTDLRTNVIDSIRGQVGLVVFGNELICYKHVNGNLTSFYDDRFQYVVGEYAEVLDYDESNVSCSAGLRVSNATFWEGQQNDGAILMCKINIEDVITVQEGKIRCKKLFVMASTDIGVY